MDRIDEAFQAIRRKDFLPEKIKHRADYDVALPIGFEQTNSQPSTVKLMLEWLDPQPGDKVLDVGSGSGWTAALLSYLVGPSGVVYAVENIPKLLKFGADNVKRAGISNVRFFQAGNNYGLLEYAPYDRILVSAFAKEIPNELLTQLKIGSKMVIPVKNSINVINKVSNDKYETIENPGFVFVPLI